MKTKPLTDFIKTDGLYQSNPKVTGEIHAGCFMYNSLWLYLRFLNQSSIQIFHSNYDLSKFEALNQKYGGIQSITDKCDVYTIKEETWCDGTFTFKYLGGNTNETTLYGHLSTNILGEPELLLVDAKTEADCFKFINLEKTNPLNQFLS